MKYFLLYIIVSTLITLVSIMFAYKPEEEKEPAFTGGKRGGASSDRGGRQKESNTYFKSKKPKEKGTSKRASAKEKRAFLI